MFYMKDNKKALEDLLKRFIENPYYEDLIEKELSIVSDYEKVHDFLESYKGYTKPIENLEEIDFLIKRFKEEHDYKVKYYDEMLKEDNLWEELIDAEETNYELGNINYSLSLKTEYIDPVDSQIKENIVGFLLANGADLGIEISAIYLDPAFRGKCYNRKPYSEILMNTALEKFSENAPKEIFAYVYGKNKGPNHLFTNAGFRRKPSDRDGYIMYSLDLEEDLKKI